MEGHLVDPLPGGDSESRLPAIIVLIVVVGVVVVGAFIAGRSSVVPRSDEESATAVGQLAGSNAELSSPATEAEPSDDDGGASVAVAEQLGWQQVEHLGDTWPVSMVSRDGRLFLFVTQDRGFRSSEGAGLEAWASEDGLEWVPLGTVIESPAVVTSVVSTPQAMIAVGSDSPTGSPRAWTSSDGMSWSTSELPTDGASPDGTRTWIHTAGGSQDLMVVIGSTQPDPMEAIVDALPEELKVDDELVPYGMSWSGPPFRASIQGPLGITVFSATAEDLGLTDEQVSAMFRAGPGDETVTVWTSATGDDWNRSEIEAGYFNQVSTTPDGNLIAATYGFSGPEIWMSSDGANWERHTSRDAPDNVFEWAGGLIGTRNTGQLPDLVRSPDGINWDSLGVDELLDGDLSWHFHPVAAGQAGIAAIARGYDEYAMNQEPEPLVLEKDGYRLTSDEMRGTLTVEAEGTELLRLYLHSEQIHDEAAVDFEARTVTFLESDTAEPFLTFTFDEIEQARQGTFAAMGINNSHQTVLFSADGQHWVVQDLAATVGDASIDMLHVTADRIMAVTSQQPNPMDRTPAPPTINIWVAEPPSDS